MSTITFPIGGKPFIELRSTDKYHVITLNNPPDNRLIPEVLEGYVDALTYLKTERKHDPKPLVTTSAIPKFFSNGLDLELAIRTEGFFNNSLFSVYKALLRFPWPTIALINGHGFAGGFILAAYHDYRIMNPDKGFLCMNELLFGATLPSPMLSIFKVKFGAARAQEIFLTAKRYTGPEALKLGLVDATGDWQQVEQLVAKVAAFAKSPSYGQIRLELYRDVLEDNASHVSNQARLENFVRDGEVYDDLVSLKIEKQQAQSKSKL